MKYLFLIATVIVLISKSYSLMGGELNGCSVSCYLLDEGDDGGGHFLTESNDFIIRGDEGRVEGEDDKDSRRPIIGMMFDKRGSKMTKYLNIRIPLPIRKSFIFKVVPSSSLDQRGSGKESSNSNNDNNNLWLAKRKFSTWKKHHLDQEKVGKARSSDSCYTDGLEGMDSCKVKVSQSTIIVFPNRTALRCFGQLVRPLGHGSSTENIGKGRVSSVPSKTLDKVDPSTSSKRFIIYPGKFLEKTPSCICTESDGDEEGGQLKKRGKTRVVSIHHNMTISPLGSSTVQSKGEREAGWSQLTTNEGRVGDRSSTIPSGADIDSSTERNKTSLHLAVSATPTLKIIETLKKWLLDAERKFSTPAPTSTTTVSWPPTVVSNGSRLGLVYSSGNETEENWRSSIQQTTTKRKSVAMDVVRISPASKEKNRANWKYLADGTSQVSEVNSSMISQQVGWKGLIKDIMGSGLNSQKPTLRKGTEGNPLKRPSVSMHEALRKLPLEDGLQTPSRKSSSSTTSKNFFMGLFKKSTTTTSTTQLAKISTSSNLERKVDKLDKYIYLNNVSTKSIFEKSQSLAFDQENEHEPEDMNDTTTTYIDQFFDLSSRKDLLGKPRKEMDWCEIGGNPGRNKPSDESLDAPKFGDSSAEPVVDTGEKRPQNRQKMPEADLKSGGENDGKSQAEEFELMSEKYSMDANWKDVPGTIKGVEFNSSTESSLTREDLLSWEDEETDDLVNDTFNSSQENFQEDYFSTTLENNPDGRTWTLFDFHDVTNSRQNASFNCGGSRNWVMALDHAILNALGKMNGSSVKVDSIQQPLVSQLLKNKVMKLSPTLSNPLMTENHIHIDKIEMTENSNHIADIRTSENSAGNAKIWTTENIDFMTEIGTSENSAHTAKIHTTENININEIVGVTERNNHVASVASVSPKPNLKKNTMTGSIDWVLPTNKGRMRSWLGSVSEKPVMSLLQTSTKKVYKDFGSLPLSWRIDEATFSSCCLISDSHSKGNGTTMKVVETPHQSLMTNRYNIFFTLKSTDYYDPFLNKGVPLYTQSSPGSTLNEEIPNESWEEVLRNKVKRPVFGVVPKQWHRQKQTSNFGKGISSTTNNLDHLEMGKELLKHNSGNSNTSRRVLPLQSPKRYRLDQKLSFAPKET